MDVKRAADLYAQGWTLRQVGALQMPSKSFTGSSGASTGEFDATQATPGRTLD